MAATPLPDNQENRLADSSTPAVLLQTLNEIMRIATSTLDITEVFEQVGEQVKRLIPWDWLNIALNPPGEDYYEVFAFSQAVLTPQPLKPGMHVPLDQAPPGEVIRTGRPIVRRYAPEESTYPIERAVVKEAGFRSLMFVPLESKGRVIGTLNFSSFQPGQYSEEELDTAQAIADHLSVVVEHTLLYKETKESADLLKTLNGLMRVAVSTLDLNQVFDRVGEQIKDLIDYTRLSIAIHPPGEDFIEMYAVTTEGQAVFPKGMRLPLRETPMGEAIRTGRAILRRTSDDFVYPIEFEMSKTIGSSSFMFVPLESKGRVIGSLNVASRPEAEYTERELHTAQEIADHLAVILEHAMLYEESKETAKLQERNRIAREIHDTLAQGLTGIIWQINSMERAIQGGQQPALESVERVRNLARECLDEARRSVWDLQSSTSITLTQSIQREVARTTDQAMRVSLEVGGEEPGAMDQQCELAVSRIAQEALNNVRRHSQAKRVMVDLAYGPTDIRLQISDDGVGFEPSARSTGPSPTGGGFGMTSMQERARLVGGRVEVRSAPGMGTRVEVEIPYQPPVEEAPIPVLRSPLVDALRKPGIGSIRVLVVDDHEVVRQGIRGMLEPTDVVVVGEAGDGETAIKQIQALEPDVVLMDIQMPTLDGVEAMRRMQELGLNTPVILLSVYAKDEYIFEGLRAGARGYLLKDVDRDELVQAIRSVHAGSSLFQPLIASRLLQRLSGEEAVGLTEREIEVLRALGAGGRDKEIADQLFLSFSTVRFHITNIYRKLGVQSRTEALLVATERGLLNT